jgi:hypothetical protein
MKKYITTIFTAVIVTIFLFSCKKNSSSPKDYTASIKDKTWWGVLVYTGKTAQYYSVHFNADNTLLWSQLAGDYTGTWSINGKQVTITFSGSGIKINADISDDDQLMNIVVNTSTYKIINGQIIQNPNIPLNNTAWKGSVVSGIATNLQLSFMPGAKVELKLGNTTYPPFIYSRTPSGGAFRFDTGGSYYYFGVIISNNEIKGSANDSEFPFQVTKQ